MTLIGAINLCVGPTFWCFHQLSLAAFNLDDQVSIRGMEVFWILLKMIDPRDRASFVGVSWVPDIWVSFYLNIGNHSRKYLVQNALHPHKVAALTNFLGTAAETLC